MSDLKQAFEALKGKQRFYNKLWQYYDGNQELVYSNSRLREAFSQLDARFMLNWCGLIVDAVLERMEFKQWTVMGNEAATNSLNGWWEASEMNLDADDVELCMLVTGEAFVITWDEGNGLQAYYNDSRLVHAFYEASNPKKMRMAAKWWDEDAGARLTLYYPDRLEYYGSTKSLKEITEYTAFAPLSQIVEGAEDAARHDKGIVPVWHFRRERRAIKSELGPAVLDTQDAVNKLLADMMVAAEFGSFRQRYVISQAETSGGLKNAPNEIWDIPAGDGLGQDTQVGEFSHTPLDNFMNQIEKLSTAMASMTRTSLYYFFLGARADPSGETLYAMDGPLVKKTSKYIQRLRAEWRQFGVFVAAQLGIPAPLADIQVEYESPHALQPMTQAQTRKTNREAGIPLTTQLRKEGWTPQELAQMQDDIDQERQAAQTSLATALLNQQRQFDAGGGLNA